MPPTTVYDLLTSLVPITTLVRLGHLRLYSREFMDLHVEVVSHRGGLLLVTFAHYDEQAVDLVLDPLVEFEVYVVNRRVRPLSIRTQGGFTRVVDRDAQGREWINRRGVRDLEVFLAQWLTNLAAQGFRYREEATLAAPVGGRS